MTSSKDISRFLANSEAQRAKETVELLEKVLPFSLAKIEGKKEPDPKDENEEKSLELAELRLKNDRQQQDIDDLKSNRTIRETYAAKSWTYLYIYSGFALFLTLMSGFKVYGFHLDWQVLAAVCGSTAANAIGLVMQINKGLFNYASNSKSNSN